VVVDVISDDQLKQLGSAARAIVEAIDPSIARSPSLEDQTPHDSR
jgi:hypothetical protein